MSAKLIFMAFIFPIYFVDNLKIVKKKKKKFLNCLEPKVIIF